MGGSRFGRVGAAVRARSRKQKAVGVAAIALVASAPFGGLNRAAEPPPEHLDAGQKIRIGPYAVTFGRAYRVDEYLGADLKPWEGTSLKPSARSRRLLVMEVDVTNGGKRPEYAQTLTDAVRIVGAAPVDGYGGPTTKPGLIVRADGSSLSILNPGMTQRAALIVEQPASTTARKAGVRLQKVTWIGEGGGVSNLDEDYWLVLDDVARTGVISIGRR